MTLVTITILSKSLNGFAIVYNLTVTFAARSPTESLSTPSFPFIFTHTHTLSQTQLIHVQTQLVKICLPKVGGPGERLTGAPEQLQKAELIPSASKLEHRIFHIIT